MSSYVSTFTGFASINPRSLPYGEIDLGSTVKFTLLWQMVAIVGITGHMILATQSLWLFPIGIFLFGCLYARAPLIGVLVYFQILLYQNIIMAFLAPLMIEAGATNADHAVMQGSNFAALALMAAIAVNRLVSPPWRREVNGIIVSFMIATSVICVYTVYGTALSTPMSAAIYFRNFMGPLLALVVGMDVGRLWGYRTVGTCFLVGSLISIAMGAAEYMFPIDWYHFINAVDFNTLKDPQPQVRIYSPEDIIYNQTRDFFNTASVLETSSTSFRFGGSLVNPISYGYLLAIIGLVGISLRKSGWFLLILPLLILVGVKGPVILTLFTVGMYMAWVATKNIRLVVAFGLSIIVFYVGYGIAFGLDQGDYHVIGFVGGMKSLLSTPYGHGIGVGGNLSAASLVALKWQGKSGFQAGGADFAVESAVGVLAYQMGFAALIFFVVFFYVFKYAPIGGIGWTVLIRRQDMMFFALAMVLVNGIYQEEAYAPYAAGLLALFCGVVVTNNYRRAVPR